MKMLDLEGQWTDLLAVNNITGIVRGLSDITKNNKADADETLASFSSWLQRTAEFTKKEIFSLCMSRCQGLWMFLNRYSSRRVRNLLQKLKNLITLVQWLRRKLQSGQAWPDSKEASNTSYCFWNREDRELKRHLWMGRLVEWWSLMGLLPKHQESKGEKQIAHMWKEMSESHQKSGLGNSDGEGGNSVIQGLVKHLVQQHGSLWTPGTGGAQCYPPSSLKALLKLVLVPRADAQSVQAVIMYFVLDVAKFLRCRNDLFKSFCQAFTIPPSFSHQIRAFWMLDHGLMKTAVDLLLSPRTAPPRFPWQHRCILTSLLSMEEHLLALRYLHLTSPALESVEDVKLQSLVFLHSSCVSEAWALIKRHRSEDTVNHFLQACSVLGLSPEASKYTQRGDEVQMESDAGISLLLKVGPPRPLSAALCSAQRERVLSVDELLRLLAQAVDELRPPRTRALRERAWPQHGPREAKADGSESFLSTEVSFLRSPSPSIVEIITRGDDYHQPEMPDPSGLSQLPPVHGRPRVSFSSVSSLSPIRKDQTFSYESTVTLQQISALLIQDQEEEEVSQVFVAAEVLPECQDRTLEGAAAPVIDHAFAPHSFRGRFCSTDCCTDLPSLPEEILQTPTTPNKPVALEESEIFQEDSPTISNSLLQNEPLKEVVELRAEETCSEIPLNPVTVDNQTTPSLVKTDNQPVPAVIRLPDMNATQFADAGAQEDKDASAGRSGAGKVSARTRRARKHKSHTSRKL